MQGIPAPAFDFLDGHRRSRLYRANILNWKFPWSNTQIFKEKLVREAHAISSD
jgi:hypothetical protein